MKKLLSILLLLSLLISVAACNMEQDPDTTNTDDTSKNPTEDVSGGTSEDDPNAYYTDRFGDIDFKKSEIWIYDLNTSPDSHVNHYHDYSGNTINVALYSRDLMFEELYGITFEYFNNTAGSNLISNSVLGGSYVADIIYGRASGDRLMSLAQKECLMDMRSVSALSFEDPWWSNFMSESLTVNNKMYFTSGDILPSFYQSIGCFFFNIDSGVNYSIDKNELAELTLDGKWTWEQMKTLSAKGYMNLDSNEEMTVDADQFGYLTYSVYNHTNMFAIGAGIKLCEQGDDDKWTIDITSANKVETLSKLLTYMDNQSGSKSGVIDVFKNGRAIFAAHFVESAFGTLKDMTDDYLMLPIPKLEETQDDYYCMVNSYVNCFVGILSNCADVEITGAVLESMAYAGYTDIHPIVYEEALKGRLSRDPLATDLIDRIFACAYIDYGVIEKFGVNKPDYAEGVSTVLFNYLKNGKPLVSEFENIKAQAVGELENTLKIFMK